MKRWRDTVEALAWWSWSNSELQHSLTERCMTFLCFPTPVSSGASSLWSVSYWRGWGRICGAGILGCTNLLPFWVEDNLSLSASLWFLSGASERCLPGYYFVWRNERTVIHVSLNYSVPLGLHFSPVLTWWSAFLSSHLFLSSPPPCLRLQPSLCRFL